ncbi:helix-hairpin-helix domain-containing protein [Micromonospora sp. NPDC048170]|uniref:ComEA family DNA-binding protein n=1 Tax=Micromonospora sp. NPDC048170 TaxID=3154819 RepID=UPI0033E247B3
MSNAPSPGWPPPAAPRQRAMWQVLHSWWLLLPVLGFTCLGGFGFIYVGLRARRAAWWIPGILYTLVGWATIVVVGESEKGSTAGDWGAGAFIAVWIASIMHAALINPAWLRWLADRRARYSATSWPGSAYPLAPLPGMAPAGPITGPHPGMSPPYPGMSVAYPPGSPGYPPAAYPPGYLSASPAYPSVSPAHPSAPPAYPSVAPAQPSAPPAHPPGYPFPPAADPTMAPYQPVDHFGSGPVATPASQPARPAGGQPAPGLIDVNAAGPGELAALPGFDPQRAWQVLAERERRGSFGSLAEFAAAANLAPHEYARLRDILDCVPPAGPPHGQPPAGRVLDV